MVIVESRLIFFSSALLIAAGGLVLWMRYHNAAEPVEYVKPDDSELLLDAINDDDSFHDHERRIDDDRGFPLLDDNGAMIAFDRRSKESVKKD